MKGDGSKSENDFDDDEKDDDRDVYGRSITAAYIPQSKSSA